MKHRKKSLNKSILLLGLLLCEINETAQAQVSLKFISENNDVWMAPQCPNVTVRVFATKGTTIPISLNVITDDCKPVATMQQQLHLDADSTEVSFSFAVPNPGFYRCTINVEGANSVTRNIGYEPERIVTLPDAQPDFDAFWANTLAELTKVNPNYSISEEKDKSGKTRKVYLVKMMSVDNEPICGYLTMPVKKGKYPTIIHYMGYHNKPWYAKPDENPDWIEFVLSVRGQSLNEPTNHYGEWIYSGLESKEKYYYRGAYADVVRAIDYVCTLPQVDRRYLFAEGGSQGGAFTYAACALDKRVMAACPWIPFMNDFPDYFRIEPWPGNLVTQHQKKLGISDADMYKTLSYFDIKNFARRISCPILMGWGLQDHTCPPRTNFAGYNLLRVPKQQIEYPDAGHIDLAGFPEIEMRFFKEYMKNHQ